MASKDQEALVLEDQSQFAECKTCGSMMTKAGHGDGRCYECRRFREFGRPIIELLRSIDASLKKISEGRSK